MPSIVTINRVYSTPKSKDVEKIVSATYKDPKTNKVTEGKDHMEANPDAPEDEKDRETPEYGFKTSQSRMVSRMEAYDIAKKAGQLKSKNSQKILHSSNLKTKK